MKSISVNKCFVAIAILIISALVTTIALGGTYIYSAMLHDTSLAAKYVISFIASASILCFFYYFGGLLASLVTKTKYMLNLISWIFMLVASYSLISYAFNENDKVSTAKFKMGFIQGCVDDRGSEFQEKCEGLYTTYFKLYMACRQDGKSKVACENQAISQLINNLPD